jgi:c-di-GMP-binding flagellar brake protein YcgR
MERRSKDRLDVQLTCYVGAGKVQATPVRALTENVSRTGMLMRWMRGVPLPAVEGKLTLDLELPENSDFGPRVMRCSTQVVRVTPCDGDTHSVALRVLAMRFLPTARGKLRGKLTTAAVTARRESPRDRQRETTRDLAPKHDLASMPVAANRVN